STRARDSSLTYVTTTAATSTVGYWGSFCAKPGCTGKAEAVCHTGICSRHSVATSLCCAMSGLLRMERHSVKGSADLDLEKSSARERGAGRSGSAQAMCWRIE